MKLKKMESNIIIDDKKSEYPFTELVFNFGRGEGSWEIFQLDMVLWGTTINNKRGGERGWEGGI